jgi:TET-associated glycosyltransferase-like protein
MLIVIPSRGRADPSQQVTLRNFERLKIKRDTLLAVPAAEYDRYCRIRFDGMRVVKVPGDVRGISETRAWIMTDLAIAEKQRYVCMMDDDLDFCWRPDMRDVRLSMADGPQTTGLLDVLEGWLKREQLVHVGVSARQNNHQFPSASDVGENGEPREWREAARMMNMYAYDTQFLRKNGLKLGRIPVMEDFDLTLQLLRMGVPNRVSYRWCWNQRGSGKIGGCSTYRTAEMQADAARKLAEWHGDFVRLKIKTSKKGSGSWEGMKERLDVNVQWQMAYRAGLEARERVRLVR